MYGNGGILKMLGWIVHANELFPELKLSGPCLTGIPGESSHHLGEALGMTTPEDPWLLQWVSWALGGLQKSCPLFLVPKGGTLAKIGPVPSATSPQAPSHINWGVPSPEAGCFTFGFLMPKMSLYVALCCSGHFEVSAHCRLCIFSPCYSLSHLSRRAGLTHPSLQGAMVGLQIHLFCCPTQFPVYFHAIQYFTYLYKNPGTTWGKT